MMNLRRAIRKILKEKKEFRITDSSGAGLEGEFDFSAVDDVINTIQTANLAQYGYNVVSVEQAPQSEMTGMLHLEVILQHAGPDFAKFIDQLVTRGGKFASIYGDTPKSKTMITRYLTGFKDGADIDARQKSAAIKVAQLAGLEALQPTLDQIKNNYDQIEVIANFTGAKTRKKGQSFFEVFVMPPYVPPGQAGIPEGELPEPPEQPESIPVDGEEIQVPIEPVHQAPPVSKPPKKPRKARKPRKKKMPKLTGAQKKKGYNQINSKGDIRHVLAQSELEDISDHMVDVMFGPNSREIDELGPEDAADAYSRLRNHSNDRVDQYSVYRVLDDYYDNPLPRLVFYGCKMYRGRIRTRSIMSQYTSYGSDRMEGFTTDEEGEVVKGMVRNIDYGVDDFEKYTSPKLGGKNAKDIRRYVNQQKANDELIIYAIVEPQENKYTGKKSRHTGSLILYVFQLDRNFPEEG